MDLLKSKAKSTLSNTETLENEVLRENIVNTSCIGKTPQEAQTLITNSSSMLGTHLIKPIWVLSLATWHE